MSSKSSDCSRAGSTIIDLCNCDKSVYSVVRNGRIAPQNIEAAPTDLPLYVTTTIRMAIRQIEIGKAAAPDNIPDEALKSNIEVTANMLHVLFRKI
ncbi:unnamed protein product [Schistosoma curassoni]|uniref:DZF domain-containing protein n=1 Tax=Schistosoma curassoni TaxID=6186 RepID=A0A183JHL9_9TREM|nr:unnamed protein product [Schistosoma curassoni]